ncbi:MAG: LysM peptidoglycan-binding domain-containing protein [Bacteroidota bacterium]
MTRLLLLCGLLLFVAAPPTLAQTATEHVVERGDTLFSIAQRYGTSVFDLRQTNNLLSNRIQVGQTLQIPSTAPPPPAEPPPSPLAATPPVPAVLDDTGTLVHTIRAGETLYRLSVWYDTSVDELMGWNGLNSTQLSVGQRMVVRPAALVAEAVPVQAAPSNPPPPVSVSPAPDVTPEDETGPGGVDEPQETDPGAPDEAVADGAGGGVPASPEPTDLDAEPVRPSGPPVTTPSPVTGPPPVPGATLPGGLSDAYLADDPEDGAPSETAPPSEPPPAPAVPLPPPRTLQPAEAVQLATAPPPFVMTDTTVPADEAHLVRRGETLYAVASRYQISTQVLVNANPGLTTAPLVAGQLLILPEEVGTMQYHRTVQAALPPPFETGQVLVYPDGLAGRAMASGVAYDPDALLGSHRDLPFGSVVLVTNPALQRSVFVRIADRGPVSGQFVMELSRRAAEALGLDPAQAASVDIRMVP